MDKGASWPWKWTFQSRIIHPVKLYIIHCSYNKTIWDMGILKNVCLLKTLLSHEVNSWSATTKRGRSHEWGCPGVQKIESSRREEIPRMWVKRNTMGQLSSRHSWQQAGAGQGVLLEPCSKEREVGTVWLGLSIVLKDFFLIVL